MDQILSQILFACNLAEKLHANLAEVANRPELLVSSCEEVASAFNKAVEELHLQCGPHMFLGEAMDLLGLGGTADEINPFYVGGGPTENEMAQAGGTGDIHVAVVGSSSGYGRRPAGSLGHRSSRKRKDKSGMSTIRVSAVRTGNMDIPPDDGFTWRKYGQKDILRTKFPRSYYRCTHKNFYGCEAKKQVQRLDQDQYPSTTYYEVTYCGEHTCQTSTTPLLILPPPPPPPPPPPHAELPISFSSSISGPIELGMISNWFPNHEISQRFPHDQSREPNNIVATTSADNCPVTDLADVMFNSASSGSSSMDAIFSLKQLQNQKDKEE